MALEPVAGSGGLVRCLRQQDLVLSGVGDLHPVGVTTGVEEAAADRCSRSTALRMTFPVRTGPIRRVTGSVRAVDGVDLRVPVGRTVGLVGESGSGKSTLARLILRLVDPTEGTIVLDGNDLTHLGGRELRRTRRSMQIVFQDPYSSLDPRMRVNDIVGEPLEIYDGLSGAARDNRVAELLDQVGLGRYALYRRPHEFSGGQRQRIAIARALAPESGPARVRRTGERPGRLDPVAGHQPAHRPAGPAWAWPSSSSPTTCRSSVTSATASPSCTWATSSKRGRPRRSISGRAHPYTQALLSAIPVPDVHRPAGVRRIVLAGEVANPLDPPSGCTFHPRCPYAMDICSVGGTGAGRHRGGDNGALPPAHERSRPRWRALGGSDLVS